MTTTDTKATISVDALRGFCIEALRSAGVSDEHARITSDVLLTTDTWGVYTHGTKLLPLYVRRLRAGGLRTDQEPVVAEEGKSWACVDGRSCLGQVVSTFAMQKAVAKARESGIGYVGVRNSCHFGAAGYYTWLAAKQDMIGIAMANDIPSVAAPGSRGAILGSNPIAYAVPVANHDPILLDISIASVAGGKVYAKVAKGEPIPEGWIVGPDGRPTTDGSIYPHEASLAPMGGHKGYGLGLLIEILTATLSGAAMTWQVGSWIFGEPDRPTDHGAAFLVIDVGTIMPRETFLRRTEALVREIHEAPTADGCERILLPGEREWNLRRHALKEGLSLPPDVLKSLTGLADDSGISFPELQM